MDSKLSSCISQVSRQVVLMLSQALCTEASLHALRRSYPQIYDADEKMLIDPRRVAVERRDFMAALDAITPASHRSAAAHARCTCPTARLCHMRSQECFALGYIFQKCVMCSRNTW